MRNPGIRCRVTMVMYLAIIASNVGCAAQKQTAMVVPPPPSGKTLNRPPEITSETEEGFADLLFFLEDRKDLAAGEQVVTATGIYKGQKVGIGIGISSGWSAKSDGEPLPIEVRAGKIALRRKGSESDALLQAMAKLYGVKSTSRTMRDELTLTGLSLVGNPGRLDAGPANIKLFHESDREGEYAELFLNIDAKARRVEIREKDPEYRAAVIRALSDPGKTAKPKPRP